MSNRVVSKSYQEGLNLLIPANKKSFSFKPIHTELQNDHWRNTDSKWIKMLTTFQQWKMFHSVVLLGWNFIKTMKSWESMIDQLGISINHKSTKSSTKIKITSTLHLDDTDKSVFNHTTILTNLIFWISIKLLKNLPNSHIWSLNWLFVRDFPRQ